MTIDELHNLQQPHVQALLAEHSADNPAAFAMQFHGRKELPIRAMAEQLACRQRAVKKLPTLSQHNLLYAPLALEQASGERTAAYKASLMSGKRAIDLSGGLGVDAMSLARVFHEVIYCERDPLLCELVTHNLNVLGIMNVAVNHGDSLTLLESFADDYFDWIFVDPARREQGQRSIALESTSPDVVAHHNLLLRKAQSLCIKASPALEISGLKSLLPSLQQVVVVSVDRECKEILLLLERNEPTDKPVTVKAVCLNSDSENVIEIIGDGEAQRVVTEAIKAYLYEPDPAIIKAKLSAVLAQNHGLEFVNQMVDYLTSDRKIECFPGRKFRVVECIPYKPKSFKAFLQQHSIAGASIQRRDFPVSAEELRKKYRLREDERAFLFFTKDSSAHPICIYALRCFPRDETAPSAQSRSAALEC